jgi:hypothetical protein
MNRYRMRSVCVLLAVLTFSVPTPTAAATPDAVIQWNQHATNALIVTAGQAPPVAVLHLAMVQGAVYDAVNAIDGGYQPYLGSPTAMSSYSKDAAAIAAAYGVLKALVPAQTDALTGLYDASLASIPNGPAKTGGIGVGEVAAAAMLAARANDGRFGTFRFTVPTNPEPGQWVPTLPAFVNDPNAWLARVTPFLIDDPARFRSSGPNALTSKKYAQEFAEVKSLGSATSTTRTVDQTNAALFWAQQPAATWSATFRKLSADRGLTITENARLFAMLYLTGADAAIACWDDKARWSFWRPITAIRQAATDGNPATVADPGWLPLIANPPYPDHPSGHACLSGSVVHTLADFFGTDNIALTVVRPDGMTRSFTRFSHAIDEIVEARMWSGIHFRTPDEDGAKIGKKVANWRQGHYFHRRD